MVLAPSSNANNTRSTPAGIAAPEGVQPYGNDSGYAPVQVAGMSLSMITLYLSLFLLLLAFFVFLNAHSTYEVQRGEAVLTSLKQTFSGALKPSKGAADVTGRTGDIVSPEQILAETISPIFATDVPTARLTSISPSGDLEVRFLANALFHDLTADLRQPRRALLDRLSAALSAPPPGWQINMTALFTPTLQEDGAYSLHQGLAMTQAGTLARLLGQYGAPPATVRVGLSVENQEGKTLKNQVPVISSPAMREIRLIFSATPAVLPSAPPTPVEGSSAAQ